MPNLVLDLRVAPTPVAVGDTATITLEVINQAPNPAVDLVVTLAPPDGAVPLPGPGLVSAA